MRSMHFVDQLKEVYRRVYILGSHWGEYRASWLKPAQPHRNHERVLDAGCGRGEILHEFQRKGIQVDYYGIDLAVGDPSWDFKVSAVADLHLLPFRDSTFDKVISNQVLEHVDHPHRVFQELTRVLKPGGCLFISVPLVWHLHQEPYDRFRFTANSIEFLAREQGVTIESITPMGGYFTVCRYVIQSFGLVSAQFWRPLSLVSSKLIHFFDLTIGAPLFYFLDKLDQEKKLTLGYFVQMRKPALSSLSTSRTEINVRNSALICPYCVQDQNSSFQYDLTEWICTTCERKYQVSNGVPVLIPSGSYQLKEMRIARPPEH